VRCAAARACGDEFERRRVTHGRTTTHARERACRADRSSQSSRQRAAAAADMGHAESSMQ
jgi:endonuclease III